MTCPFAMRSYCAFRPAIYTPNYRINNSTDDNAPSVGQYPGLGFPNKDNVNCYAPSLGSEYTIEKKLANPHEQKVEVEHQEKTIKASASPIGALQRGMGQVNSTVLNAFEHPVMKTSKITVGAGKAQKRASTATSPASTQPKKISKIKYI